MPDNQQQSAYLYMDAARAVFAVVVAFGHIWALLIRDYVPNGNLGVDFLYFAAGFGHACVILFFVLSGYWITRSVASRARRGWSWRAYLTDRLVRLMLVIVPALVLGGLLDWLAIHWLASPTHRGATETYVVARDVGEALTPLVFTGNLLFLQEIFVPPFGSNGPLWSVAFEFWYYLWFPSLWLLFRQRRVSILLASLAIGWFEPAVALGFVSWLCGSLVFLAEERLTRTSRWASPRRFAVLPAAALFVTVLLWGRTGNYLLEDPILAIGFAFLLLALLQRPPRAVSGVRVLARYGAGASFSLYAVHFPLMAMTTAMLISTQRLAPTPATVALTFAILGGTVGFAWIFAKHTEAWTARARGLFDATRNQVQ